MEYRDADEMRAGVDTDLLLELFPRLQAATESSTDLDAEICRALGGGKSGHLWRNPVDNGWTGAPHPVSRSVDAALALAERAYPSTDDIKYSTVSRSGQRPDARILYQIRDTDAEGGWAIGAINPLQVWARLHPLAIVAAVINAILVERLNTPFPQAKTSA